MTKVPTTDWRNRIVRYGEMPANQFQAHPFNARRHPNQQREALRGSFDVLGIIAPVLVNKSGYLIDGHARIEECLSRDENMMIPFIEVDLDENEEAIALASYDFISSLAYYDKDNLNTLLSEIDTDNVALQSLLSDLAEKQGVIPPTNFNPMDEWNGMPEFEQEAINAFHDIRVVFETEHDMRMFAQIVNQTITDKTTSIYYPRKEKREVNIYKDGEE